MFWVVLLMTSWTFRELMATECSDAATKNKVNHVLRMCESGNSVGKQIVVDTFDSALYGVGSCQCDVHVLAIPPTTAVTFTFFSVKNLEPGGQCKSYIEININSTSKQFHCGLLKKHSYSLSTNSCFPLIWRRSLRSSTSEYCLQLETKTSNVSLNITCLQTDRPMESTSSSLSTASTIIASTNDPLQIYTVQTTGTLSYINGSEDTLTTTLQPVTSMSLSTGRETTFTTTESASTLAKKDVNILMTILVPTAAAGGGFILILTVIVLVVMCKRNTKGITTEETKDSESGIRANTLYISADEIADIKQQDGHTNNGFLTDQDSTYDTSPENQNEMELSNVEQPQRTLYAVVNKKNKSCSVKEETPISASCNNPQNISDHDSFQSPENQNEIELSNIEQPQRALYAVVNKKNKSESVKGETPIAASCNNPQNISDHDSLQSPENQNEMEFQNTEQTQAALYAVVNKKNESGSVKDKTPLATSYKNQEGLNYTQVEVNTDSSSPSDLRSVRISSKETEGDRVTYSEVTISD